MNSSIHESSLLELLTKEYYQIAYKTLKEYAKNNSKDNQQVQLQDIALKGMCCLLLSFVAIPHDYDLSQREGNARLPPNVKTKILNEHYMMAYKDLKDYARNNGTGRNRQERTSRKD